LLVACAKTTSPESGGSESHFLDACTEASECGPELSCRANVCTRECESAAQCEGLGGAVTCEPESEAGICDLLCEQDDDCEAMSADAHCSSGRCREQVQQEVDSGATQSERELLGTSELLGEPAQLAFIAGEPGEEQLYVWGVSGAVKQVSVWPAAAGATNTCALISSSRFTNITFDSSGEYLAFIERESCVGFGDERLVLYELATGRSQSLGSFEDVEVSAGPRTMIASVRSNDGNELYEIVPATSTLSRIDVPAGADANSYLQDIVAFDGDEILFTTGTPFLRMNDDGVELFDPLVQLDPKWQLGILSTSPSGDQLCVTARDTTLDPEIDEALAILVTLEHVSMQPTVSFDFTCAFSADGRYVMYGGAAFEVEGDELVALPLPSERMSVVGAHGDFFFGTSGVADVVRFNPATGTSEILVGLDAFGELCEGGATELPLTQLYLAEDARGVGIVQHYCGEPNADRSGSLALDLETGEWAVIEAAADAQYVAYDVAWPSDGHAWLFSALAEDDAPSFYEISAGLEVKVHRFDQLDGTMHTPALPPR
jgi:hypothetical protein